MNQTQPGRQAHLFEVVKEFETAMLVTRTPEGRLRARPMALAEARSDGELYFVTGADSPKVHELEADPQVNVTFQGKTRYASISGVARVVRDRALLDRLWRESWKVWFPQGKDDPSLCLLAVRPEEGEYWDHFGVKGLRLLVEAARAYVQGRTPTLDQDQHAKVAL